MIFTIELSFNQRYGIDEHRNIFFYAITSSYRSCCRRFSTLLFFPSIIVLRGFEFMTVNLFLMRLSMLSYVYRLSICMLVPVHGSFDICHRKFNYSPCNKHSFLRKFCHSICNRTVSCRYVCSNVHSVIAVE